MTIVTWAVYHVTNSDQCIKVPKRTVSSVASLFCTLSDASLRVLGRVTATDRVLPDRVLPVTL